MLDGIAERAAARPRAGIEGHWRLPLKGGASLEPRLALGLRHDGGDAETGLGLELGGGIGWEDPTRGLSLDIAGRRLIAHDDDERAEWGIAIRLGWDLAPATGRGPALHRHPACRLRPHRPRA